MQVRLPCLSGHPVSLPLWPAAPKVFFPASLSARLSLLHFPVCLPSLLVCPSVLKMAFTSVSVSLEPGALQPWNPATLESWNSESLKIVNARALKMWMLELKIVNCSNGSVTFQSLALRLVRCPAAEPKRRNTGTLKPLNLKFWDFLWKPVILGALEPRCLGKKWKCGTLRLGTLEQWTLVGKFFTNSLPFRIAAVSRTT